MSLSMYDLTIPVMLRSIDILIIYMDKAEHYAEEKGIAPEVLINARLAPDMLPLSGQIQRFSDNCKGSLARLAAIEAPSLADDETSFVELKERLEKTAVFLKTIKPEQLAGSENHLIELKLRGFSTTLSGKAYLLSMVLPNIFFHMTTTHDILRHNGMNIGKLDYLGNFN